ncbi:MAG: MFS transporter [Caldilinea sp. CFX5]|nr:MFS transporter [Caldilinea sp. CFX5]
MFSLLKQRNFGLLWFGGLISITGDWVVITVLPYFLYDQTGSTLVAGSLNLAYSIPALLFGSVAGVFADRWHRQRTMMVVSFLQAAFILLLVVRAATALWLIFAVVTMQSTLSQFFTTAENALLPNLVGKEQLVTANALNALNDNLGRIIGPVIGGLVFAAFSLHGAVIADSMTFLLAGLLIGLMQTPAPRTRIADQPAPTNRKRLSGFLREWSAGLRLIRTSRFLTALFGVTGIAILGDSILSALLIPFIDTVANQGVQAVGWLFSIRGVAGLLGGLLVPLAAQILAPKTLLGVSLLVLGSAVFVAVALPTFWVITSCMLLLGMATIGWLSTQQALLQSGATDAVRGRVFGAYRATNGLMLLIGTSTASVLGDRIGISPLLTASAVLYALAGLVALFVLSRIPQTIPYLGDAGYPRGLL